MDNGRGATNLLCGRSTLKAQRKASRTASPTLPHADRPRPMAVLERRTTRRAGVFVPLLVLLRIDAANEAVIVHERLIAQPAPQRRRRRRRRRGDTVVMSPQLLLVLAPFPGGVVYSCHD